MEEEGEAFAGGEQGNTGGCDKVGQGYGGGRYLVVEETN